MRIRFKAWLNYTRRLVQLFSLLLAHGFGLAVTLAPLWQRKCASDYRQGTDKLAKALCADHDCHSIQLTFWPMGIRKVTQFSSECFGGVGWA
ncbi:Uncharacterised protein [Vibrio cholerae]|nr:Uncharacterised protein [Vibrio cholerae]